jgi:periplasmic glucans biosynthesis protein
MPTADETNDNIVASWVADDDLQVGKPTSFAYAITAALSFDDLFPAGKVLATFQTAARALGSSEPNLPNVKRFIIDFKGGDLAYFRDDPGQVQVVVTTSKGTVRRSYTQYNPFTFGFRGTLDIEVPPGEVADLRAYLRAGPTTLTETWVYTWEAPPAPPVLSPASSTTPPAPSLAPASTPKP